MQPRVGMKTFHHRRALRAPGGSYRVRRGLAQPLSLRRPVHVTAMKSPIPLFCALLALGSHATMRADISAAARLETFYLIPQADELPRMIRELSRDDYFAQPGHTALAIGFISTVFARHPDRVDRWLLELNGLPLKTNRLLAAALWQADHPLGPDLLRILGQFSQVRADLERLAGTPVPPLLETPVRSASSMNLRWGAFFADGDPHHVVAVIDAVGADDASLAALAGASLARMIAAHPRVKEICGAELARQPLEGRARLQAVLQVAEPIVPRG